MGHLDDMQRAAVMATQSPNPKYKPNTVSPNIPADKTLDSVIDGGNTTDQFYSDKLTKGYAKDSDLTDGSIDAKFNTLTANEYHVTILSSSTLYSDGNTIFGNSSDDVHQFTGSLKVTNGITGSLNGTATSVYTPSGTANRILYQSAGGASSNTTTDSALTWNSGTGTITATSMAVASAGTFKSALDGTNNISLHDGTFGLIKITNGGTDRITLYRTTDTIQLSGSLLVNPNSPTAKHQITGSVEITGSLSVNGNAVFNTVTADSNGLGQNFKVGDDVWIGDRNVSNTMVISGIQDPTTAIIQLGSGSQPSIAHIAIGAPFPTVGSALAITGSLLIGHTGHLYIFNGGVSNGGWTQII